MKSLHVLFAVGLVADSLMLGSAPASAATITGTVLYTDDIPNLLPLKMKSDPMCAVHSPDGAPSEALVLGPNKQIANVFVRVKSGLGDEKFPVPEEPVVLDQKGCVYTPHVFGVRVGQKLKVLNPDNTLHNVHAMPRLNAPYNIAMPQF